MAKHIKNTLSSFRKIIFFIKSLNCPISRYGWWRIKNRPWFTKMKITKQVKNAKNGIKTVHITGMKKKLMYTITWLLFMFISHVHIHMIWFHIKACTHGHHVHCQNFCSMQQFASLMRFFLNRTLLYCKMCLIRFTINGQLKDVSRTHM